MDNVLSHLVLEAINWIKKNFKKPKFWIVVLALITIVLVVWPWIDSTFLYYNRMQNRISILQQVSELDVELIGKNPVLQEEYETILVEIQVQANRRTNSPLLVLANVINDRFQIEPAETKPVWKFIAGAFWCMLITILIPFMNTFKCKRDKWIGFVIFVFLSMLAGGIFANVPTVIHPYVNYFGVPIIQLIVFVYLMLRFNHKKQT